MKIDVDSTRVQHHVMCFIPCQSVVSFSAWCCAAEYRGSGRLDDADHSRACRDAPLQYCRADVTSSLYVVTILLSTVTNLFLASLPLVVLAISVVESIVVYVNWFWWSHVLSGFVLSELRDFPPV